ncbi:uncharacterized protein MELLADRAFT_87632 [Melampsora larici-populina 98AG31]|uniref:Secreted protein n=1 Tax=Melampsora larici-populina (strain 98AG31 / pathotype 3-4-7) TaxID=747676 RepID=F4RP49_MELLP|nr:uncharacterized protein MELLADRAFT_87632 [Melampsora larici-populina 98AG31]EGG05758.1 hypothetical protein MELLADRAFT_87632 [Melampsora larici-populina 98AG31]
MLASVFFLVWYNCFRAVSGGNLNLNFTSLYPENGAVLPSTGMMYYSACYRATVVKFDSKQQTFKEITIPSVTGQPNTHVSGIEADRSRALIWAVVDAASAFDTNGGQLSGPAGLVGIDTNDKILYNVDLNPALKEVQRLNGGVEVGGAQDATTDNDGNVYVPVAFGQAILKFDPKTQKTSVFYFKMNPKPHDIGYTGIEFVNSKTLILWNNVNRRIETIDITSRKIKASVPKGAHLPKPTVVDAIYIPSFSKGTCLLLNNVVENQVEVMKTRNNWKSVIHTASISTKEFDGISTFTYEIDDRMYFGSSAIL